MAPRRGVLALFVAVAMALGSCTEGEEAHETPDPGNGRGITITEPEDGAELPPRGVTVSVEVEGFEVVSKLGEDRADGEGHLHFSRVLVAADEEAVTREGVDDEGEATTSLAWKRLEAGTHILSVQLVNNDHTPLSPPARASIRISVKEQQGGDE